MAKAMKCDICNGFFDLYSNKTSSNYEETMSSLPNNIVFNVKFDDGTHIDAFTHFVHENPANSILSSINTGRASYDVCPDCMNEILSVVGQLYLDKKEVI